MFTDNQGDSKETSAEISIEHKLDLILLEFKKLEGAFARNEDGTVDFDGHRRYHEAMIKAAEEQAAFWRELKIDIAKKGLWGLLVILCGLFVAGLTAKTGISLK
jgi:hypothetical protein